MGYMLVSTADEPRIADEIGKILQVNARNEQRDRDITDD